MSNSSTSEFSCRDIHIFPYRGDPRGSGPGSRSTISEARQTFCRPQLLPPELYADIVPALGHSPTHPCLARASNTTFMLSHSPGLGQFKGFSAITEFRGTVQSPRQEDPGTAMTMN